MHSLSTFKNGLTVIVEEAAHFESAAYELLIPGGVLMDGEDSVGESLVMGELITRGTKELDSRALSNAFDERGIRHSEGTSFDRYVFRGSLLAEHLPIALKLVTGMVLSPSLPIKEIEPIQSLLVQDITSLNDYPSKRVMVELSKKYFPGPYARPTMGTIEGIRKAGVSRLQSLWEKSFKPTGAVLSVAGKINTKEVHEIVDQLFDSWEGFALVLPKAENFPQREYQHIQSDSAQVHIALSYPSSSFGADDYYVAKVVQGILSGGMFGRLFIEVREKKGLCYSIQARHSSTKDYGVLTAYAGTTTERAQQTLDSMLETLRSANVNLDPTELKRAIANIKANLIMAEESVASRASSNASDWFVGGRVRSLEEIQSGVEAVTPDKIDRYLKKFPVDPCMLVTVGSKPLKYLN